MGYGFGASFVALFAQLGGGIYTKAADVGADLVGKGEFDLDEDDPRNPAVVADLVGDNVGDCAGRGADLFESIAAEIVSAMILGATMSSHAKLPSYGFVMFPVMIHGFDLVVSSLGVLAAYVMFEREAREYLFSFNYSMYSLISLKSQLMTLTRITRSQNTNSIVTKTRTPTLEHRYNAPNWIYRLRKPLLVLKVGFLATLVCSVVFFYITCQWLLYVPAHLKLRIDFSVAVSWVSDLLR